MVRGLVPRDAAGQLGEPKHGAAGIMGYHDVGLVAEDEADTLHEEEEGGGDPRG